MINLLTVIPIPFIMRGGNVNGGYVFMLLAILIGINILALLTVIGYCIYRKVKGKVISFRCIFIDFEDDSPSFYWLIMYLAYMSDFFAIIISLGVWIYQMLFIS